jgi:hypothetical protein
MKTYDLSFTSKHGVPLCRFIASLSNGQTVYENHIPGKKTAWMRLKEYVIDNKLNITNIRFQAGSCIFDIPKSNSYMILYRECGVPGYIRTFKGLGSYTEINQTLSIFWFDERGVCVQQELRTVEKNHPALIFSV